MVYNLKVSLYTASTEQDALGQLLDEPKLWRVVWCEATYSGGSRKTYAGRVVCENQVVLTTHWRNGIEECRFAEFDGKRREIYSFVPEGRKRKVHIVCYIDEHDYGE